MISATKSKLSSIKDTATDIFTVGHKPQAKQQHSTVKIGHVVVNSTDLCVYALTEFIGYFKRQSALIYLAFLNASKAFDKTNHYVLFNKYDIIVRLVSTSVNVY